MTIKLLKVKAPIDDIFLDMVFTDTDGTSFAYTVDEETTNTKTSFNDEANEIKMVLNENG